jgi:hypothetical protein
MVAALPIVPMMQIAKLGFGLASEEMSACHELQVA